MLVLSTVIFYKTIYVQILDVYVQSKWQIICFKLQVLHRLQSMLNDDEIIK